MTEISYVWDNATTGDAVQAPYDSAEFSEILRAIAAAEAVPTNLSGVFRGVDNILGATIGALKVTIASGRALVHGRFYKNTAPVDVSTPTTTGTRRFRIVLQRDTTAQTVRLVRLDSTDGAGTDVALTQTASVWEEPLYRYSVTSGGVITLIADDRQYIPRHGDVSGEGSAAIHDYSQINSRPVSADSAAITINQGDASSAGSDTGHYANDDHVHAFSLPLVRRIANASKTDTTLADDSQLFLTVAANKVYMVDVWLYCQNNAITPIAGIKLNLTVPSGSATFAGLFGPDISDPAAGINNFLTAAAGVNAQTVVHARYIVAIGGSGGTIHLQWAQQVSDPSNATFVMTGSHMIALGGVA